MAVVLKKQSSSAGAGLAVDVALLIEQPKSALLPVLRKLDGWQEAVEDSITVEQFSGAMTNMVYRCGLLAADGTEQQVALMRVHASSSDLFDRQEEISTFRGVSAAGMGPKLLMLFDNGRVEEFLVQHVTLAASDLQDTMVSGAIAATMAHFHIKMSEALGSAKHLAGAGGDGVLVWSRLHSWYSLAKEHATEAELAALGMADLDTEIDMFESILMSSHPCWVALCHNDLQYGNIMALTTPHSSSSAAAAAADLAAVAAAPVNIGQGKAASIIPAADTSDRLATLQISDSADAGGRQTPAAAAAAAAAAGSSLPTPITLQALQQHRENHAAAAAAAAGGGGGSSGPETHLSADDSFMAVAGTSPARSVTSVGSFRHRSAGPSVQLPDGSIVLPGMKARPRGQSPERGKRPAGSSSSSSNLAALDRGRSTGGSFDHNCSAALMSSSLSVSSTTAAEIAAVAAAAAKVKPPSAAAVLRHAESIGELNVFVAPRRQQQQQPPPPAAAAAAAGGGSSSGRRRRQRISSSGLDTSESAEDSDDADMLLPHQHHHQASRSTLLTAASGFTGPGETGVTGVAVDQPPAAAAAVLPARTASGYRQMRKARKTPPAGYEFPTFQASDVDENEDGSSSSDYGGSSSSSAFSDLEDEQPCRIGGGSSSNGDRLYDKTHTTLPPQPPPPAAAAELALDRPNVTVITPEGTWSDKALTLIDYEYAGFNPVAFDIANHWCEWAADYHTDEPHVLDFSRLPSEHQQLIFVQEYLQSLLTGLGILVPTAATAAAAGSSAAGGQQQRAEDLWSVVSSIGGSVMSLPETEYSFRTDLSDTVSVKSHSSLQSDHQQQQQQQVPRLSTLAAAAAAADSSTTTITAAAASPAELRDIWRWIDLYQPDRFLLTQHKTLDLACWGRMCRALAEASRVYMAASHLLWALWGVIQSKVSDVDFDFDGYGQQRWKMYLATRPAAMQ